MRFFYCNLLKVEMLLEYMYAYVCRWLFCIFHYLLAEMDNMNPNCISNVCNSSSLIYLCLLPGWLLTNKEVWQSNIILLGFFLVFIFPDSFSISTWGWLCILLAFFLRTLYLNGHKIAHFNLIYLCICNATIYKYIYIDTYVPFRF